MCFENEIFFSLNRLRCESLRKGYVTINASTYRHILSHETSQNGVRTGDKMGVNDMFHSLCGIPSLCQSSHQVLCTCEGRCNELLVFSSDLDILEKYRRIVFRLVTKEWKNFRAFLENAVRGSKELAKACCREQY